ncbi:MAG: NAD(P)/FAD-dependent oxidoreductase, partial [Methanoregula sp.]|nr:NAD(P)/FAD-dependent oxidoreductase [Methanoregula sp.]
MEQYDCVVIGAGPAGLFCASEAHIPGCRILLLEKNSDPGAKLLLSGSGQCNITHGGDIRDFLSHYGETGKLLKPALFGFTNQDLIEFFRKRGLAMITEENGKVFPETYRSSDVRDVLMKECRKKGVDLRCNEPVIVVNRVKKGFEIQTPKSAYFSPVVVISTGGA